MIAANYILFALGILGATDILLYHSISHGIRSHADSRWELITHALRGPTYAALFLLVPNFQLHGLWAALLLGLLLIDVSISIADFALERRSRANLGGLPSGEYVLHMIMAMLFGAFVATTLPHALHGLTQTTALVSPPIVVPTLLRIALAIFAAGVFYSGLCDLLAARRLRAQRRLLNLR
jgi:hypothetical protein